MLNLPWITVTGCLLTLDRRPLGPFSTLRSLEQASAQGRSSEAFTAESTDFVLITTSLGPPNLELSLVVLEVVVFRPF